ncbi:MAG: rhomboid family intramembrane serine protease [Isosphaeraceae bacterium]
MSVRESQFEHYALTLGDGLHPVQWLTHNFLHYGLMHLAGNMLFLWAFGIVIEGKLGPFLYLPTYLAIGTLHGAFTQTILLRSGLSGHAAGASAVVYGLLAMCMVWAPRNELNCTAIFWIGLRVLVYQWDLYFTTVALLYIGQQVFDLILWGGLGVRPVVSEAGHLSGAFWGAVLSVVLLKAGWVDCEGWDIFSLMKKRRELGRRWKERGKELDRRNAELKQTLRAEKEAARTRGPNGASARHDDEPDPQALANAAVARVRRRIDDRDFAGAIAAYDKAARTLVNWPSQADLLALIKAMQAAGGEAESIPLMRDHCRYHPKASAKVRLKLAHLLIVHRQRPSEALRVLAEGERDALPPDLAATRKKLVRKAEEMCEEGVLELEEDL